MLSPDPSGALPAPPTHPTRLVYLGTPIAAVEPLRALHRAGHDIALVVSRGDTRRGRGSGTTPSPVKAAALELGLDVTDDLGRATTVGADLGVVVAYGRIIPRAVLEQLPMVNLHFSALPRWRGAAPVERAILAGDPSTAVDLMAVEEGLDTGGIYAEAVLPIGPDDTADELRARLVAAGADLLVTTLVAGIPPARPQQGEPTYAAKLTSAEAQLDWSQPSAVIHRRVRVGGAWTTFRGKRLKVWRTALDDGSRPGPALAPGAVSGTSVGTGDGTIVLVEVQPEGKARQPADAWSRGARPGDADRLGS